MSATEEMLFNIQKFQVLQLFTSSSAQRKVTPSYAYAWYVGVYPIGNHGGSWHEPYGDVFEVSKERMKELAEFLDDLWRENQTITFYKLEAHYGLRGAAAGGPVWDRMDLVHACRYFRLHDWFDDAFWDGMVGHSDCPSESHSVKRDFSVEDVYFE